MEKIAKLGKYPVGLSQLMCYHRPTLNTLRLLQKEHGVTMVVTAQASRECPNDVKKICDQLNIKHFYIELNGAN